MAPRHLSSLVQIGIMYLAIIYPINSDPMRVGYR
jgi:hypothetical protein